jgi:hypothetical protein
MEEGGCEHFLFYSVIDVHHDDGSVALELNRFEFDFAQGTIVREPVGDTYMHSPPWIEPGLASFWDDWELNPAGTTYAFGIYPDASEGEILTADTATGEFTVGPADRGWLGFLDDETLLAGTGTVGSEFIALRSPFTADERTELTSGFSVPAFVETFPELEFALVRSSGDGIIAIPFARLFEILDEGGALIETGNSEGLQILDIEYDFEALGSDYLLQGEVPGTVDWTISDLSVVEGELLVTNTRDFIQSDLARHILYYGEDRAIMLFGGGAIYGTIE